MVRMSHALCALATALLSWPVHAADSQDCADLLPESGNAVRRALIAEDLARLRDIGPVDTPSEDRRILALSPDGKHLAFQLRRANPEGNAYCLAMVVADVTGSQPVRIVDRGGEFIRTMLDLRTQAGSPTGIAKVITPRWSPDGRWFAYLKREGSVTQVWRANADGSRSAPITRSNDDVEDFYLAGDGNGLVFSVASLREANQAIDDEGLTGFHYDERFAPGSSPRPFPPAPTPRIVWFMDLSSGALRPATNEERAGLEAGGPHEGTWKEASNPRGDRAWLDTAAPTYWQQLGRLTVDFADGRSLACPDTVCAAVRRPWWTRQGYVRFVRREGWADGSTAIYQWRPGRGSPRRIYVTDDVLVDCVPDGDGLICLRESSLIPRRLERLDPRTGDRQLLFDPNPEFAGLSLGKPERLHLTNAYGLPSIADIVLPVGYQPGEHYPMVVVQYHTRGFLRGGTGDDYPIQAFANRGYAVLSVSKPASIGLSRTTDFAEADRINLKDFADRRSVLSSVEQGVRVAIARGIADPKRVGITGLSDGASTVMFALLHSKLFSAAAMSQCCYDPTMTARGGPGAAKSFYFYGYPKLTDRSTQAEDFWRQIALSYNADRIRTPILLQLSDDEYSSALVTYTALREAKVPIDMFVFPGEHHIKWQPAHRLAQYQRSLDWFDYWLKDARPAAYARTRELSHWEALRRDQLSAGNS